MAHDDVAFMKDKHDRHLNKMAEDIASVFASAYSHKDIEAVVRRVALMVPAFRDEVLVRPANPNDNVKERKIPMIVGAAASTQRMEVFEIAAAQIKTGEVPLTPESIGEMVLFLGDVCERNRQLERQRQEIEDAAKNAYGSVHGVMQRLSRIISPNLVADDEEE